MRFCCERMGIQLEANQSIHSLSEEDFTRLLEVSTNVTLAYNYAVVIDEMGREEEARCILERIKAIIPQYYECELRLVKQLLKRGEKEQAVKRLKEMCSELESQLKAGVCE